MASRLVLPLGLGAIAGSAMTLFYNNPQKVNKTWHWDWDRRFESYSQLVNENPDNYPVGQRTITLIRHGQKSSIKGEKGISEIGKQQAILTGKRLKDLGIKFDEIYTSELPRAQETCKIIVNELENNSVDEIVYDSNLNEGVPSIMEPFSAYKPREEVIEKIKKEAPAIINAYNTYIHRRDYELMKEEADGREDILIVGHGKVFRYFLTRLLQFDIVGWKRFCIYNCGISRIYVYDDGHIRVTHIGDNGHLPQELLTNNRKLMGF